MNWPLSDCLQYRTAYWIMEGREVRPLARATAGHRFSHLAG